MLSKRLYKELKFLIILIKFVGLIRYVGMLLFLNLVLQYQFKARSNFRGNVLFLDCGHRPLGFSEIFLIVFRIDITDPYYGKFTGKSKGGG